MLFFISIILTSFIFIFGQLNEEIIRQTRPLSSSFFDEIILDGVFDVFLSQSNMNVDQSSSVDVETTAAAQLQVAVEISDGHILSINVQGVLSVPQNIRVFIQFSGPLRRYIFRGAGATFSNLNGITNPIDAPLILEKSGTANIALVLYVNNLQALITGTGQIHFTGRVGEQSTFNIEGINEVDASKLISTRIIAEVHGTSTLRVVATEDIQINTSGLSKVFYQLQSQREPTRITSNGLATVMRLS